MKYNYFLPVLFLILGASCQIMCAQSKSGRKAKPAKQTANQQQYGCLPKDIKPETIISVTRQGQDLNGKVESENVKQRLDKLDARCQAGKLTDGKNREIRFYQLQGCWGNPPADYQEILNAQEKELQLLKKNYTVIEITCNSSGEMPY